MQSRTTLFIVISVAVVIVAVLALTYWPEGEQHKASKDLLTASKEATALWQQAEELLGTSVYLSPDGQMWHNAGEIDQTRTDAVRHGRPQAVNPEALVRLTDADKKISEAIERCAAADSADRAAALRLGARIDALTALYHERAALIADMGADAADDDASGLDLLLAAARRQTDELNQMVRLLDSFTGEGDDDVSPVQTAHAEAKAERAKVFADVSAQRDEIRAFEEVVATLEKKIETLSVQASEHRAEGRASGSAEEQLACLTRAQQLEAQIEEFG